MCQKPLLQSSTDPQTRADSSANTAHATARYGGIVEGPIDIRSIVPSALFILAIFYTLYFTRDLFQPLILAFLLHLLLKPVVRVQQRVFIPAMLASALTIAFLLTGVGYGIYQLSPPAARWLSQASHQFYELEWKLRPITDSFQEVQKATQEVEKKLGEITKDNETTEAPSDDPQPVTIHETSLSDTWLVETREFIVGAATLIVFLFLLLTSSDLLLLKLVKILPRLEEKKTAVDIMRQIEGDISVYLVTITLINICLGTIVGLGMALCGLPNPGLWGVMAGLLNYIPYLGALIGISAVAFVALLTFDSLASVWLPVGLYAFVNTLEAYVLTPMILGRRLMLNPLVIFVWLLVWGWMWGVGGALMAIPLLAVLKIVCDRIEPLRSAGELLGR